MPNLFFRFDVSPDNDARCFNAVAGDEESDWLKVVVAGIHAAVLKLFELF